MQGYHVSEVWALSMLYYTSFFFFFLLMFMPVSLFCTLELLFILIYKFEPYVPVYAYSKI